MAAERNCDMGGVVTELSGVSVVVPVGGAAPAWKRCAESLGRLDPPPGDIVVVIDGSGTAAAEEHAETARKIGANVLDLARRGGPAKARNRGADVTTGDVLFFLDSDVEVPRDLIAKTAGHFSDEGPAAILGSYDDEPGDPAFVSQYRNLLHHYVHQTSHEQASTFWSGCGAVRRSAFLDVGGFDEGYADPSIEDIELGGRLRRAGYTIRLVKDLRVKHLKRWTLASMVNTDLLKRAIPWTEQMLGAGGLVNDLNVKTRDRFSVALAFLAPAALLAALWWLPALAVATLAGASILALNAGLFGFFRRRHGLLFALGTVALYWIYLLICGVGFSVGLARHLLRVILPA